MLNRPWFTFIAAYFFWAVTLGLALWLLVLTRNTFPGLLASLFTKDPAHALLLHTIFDRVLILVGGIGWLVFMTVIEHYFRKGAGQGQLWPRAARVTGILLVLLFVVELSQSLQLGMRLSSWVSGLVMLLELALGCGLIYLSRKPVHKPAV